MSESVGDMLARLRIERGWSQVCFAEQLNKAAETHVLSRNYVSRWELDHKVPGAFWQRYIAQVLEIDPKVLREAVRRSYGENDEWNHQPASRCPHNSSHGKPSVRYRRLW